MTLRVLPEAEIELSGAAMRYDCEQEGLGADFLTEVDAAIASIADHPERFAYYEPLLPQRRFQRVGTERFPYVVVYERRAAEILIVAIAHTARQPGYWLDRAD